MANIHRINDFDGISHNNNNMNQPFFAQNPNSNFNFPFFNQNPQNIPPRSETFLQMIKTNLCPSFGFLKFIVLISIFQIFIFFITVSCASSLGPQFLQPDFRTLISFGAKYPYNMKYNFQIWRFILPICLHASFMHLFSNILSQMIFGLALEATLGTIKMSILYLVSGFGGYLISSLANDSISVGASGAIMGVFGGFFAYFMKNWEELAVFGPLRYTFLCILSLICFLNLVGGAREMSTVDGWGHFGGLVTGFLVGLTIVPPIFNGESQKKLRLYGLILLCATLLICFICFYTVSNPEPL